MCEEKHFLFKDKNSESLLWNKIQLFREEECMVDVTLACGGKLYAAHKLVLSASSEYFKEIFSTINNHFPIVFLRDVSCDVLEALLEFIYSGEVNVSQYDIGAFMKTAEELRVRGLSASDTEALLKSYKGKSFKRLLDSKNCMKTSNSKRLRYCENKNNDNSEEEYSSELDPEVEDIGITFTDLLTNEAGVSSGETLSHSHALSEDIPSSKIHLPKTSFTSCESTDISNEIDKEAPFQGNEHYSRSQYGRKNSDLKEENLTEIKEEPIYMTVDMDGEPELLKKRETSKTENRTIGIGTDIEELMRNSLPSDDLSSSALRMKEKSNLAKIRILQNWHSSDKPLRRLKIISRKANKETVCIPVPNYTGSRKCLQTKFKNYLSLLEVDLTHPLLEVDLTANEENDHPSRNQDYGSSHMQILNQNPVAEKYQYLDLIEELKNNSTLGPFLAGTLEDILDRPSLQSVFRDIVIDYLDKNNFIRSGSSCSIRWQYSLLGKTIYEAFPNVMWEKGEITCKKSKAEKKDRKRPVNAWTLMMHKVATVRKERKRIAKKKFAIANLQTIQPIVPTTMSPLCPQISPRPPM